MRQTNAQFSQSALADSPLFRLLPRLIGAVVAFFGLLVMVSWYAHWRAILQMLPDTAPIQFNAAICFVLCGLGLVLLTTRKARIAPWLGGAATLLAALTLAEYFTGRDFGIDQLFSKPYFVTAIYPGRMAPLAALGFVLVGVEIMLTNYGKNPARRLAGEGLLASAAAAIACVALSSYLFEIEPAQAWGADTRMAVNSAAAMLALSSGLLLWTWQTLRWENSRFLRWPIVGAATLIIMVAIISAENMSELKVATALRKHSPKVISAAQSFQDSFLKLQRDVRGYVTTGTSDLLASYQPNLGACTIKLNLLAEMITDNPAQQARLKAIGDGIQNAKNFDDRLISVYQRSGPHGVMELDATGESRTITAQVLDDFKAFIDEELKLLDLRHDREETDYRSVKNLLLFGGVVAITLLIVANYMASHELKVRRRIESRLNETLNLQNAILGSSSYAIIALDSQGCVRTFNPAAERMLGYSAAEVIGKATPMLWRDPAEVAAQAEKISRELGRPVQPGIELITGKTVQVTADEYEAVYVRKDGSRFPRWFH